tara:strand:+ start:45254 stop:50704 length:5451 start_codon:yes stop_codon:yes gene_type:complete
MTSAVIAIRNPLNMADRESYTVQSGTTVAEAMPSSWDRGLARVNGKLVESDYVIQDDDGVVLFFQPEGLSPIVVNILVSIAISAAFALLFPPPKPKKKRDDESSATYGFRGITNNRGEGEAIPVSFGKIRAGGTIINEFIDVEGLPARTTLRQLISFGEGPFYSIGGVKVDTPAAVPLVGNQIPPDILINGNPAQNFKGVKVWVRLGTNEQELIPGFNETRTAVAVGSELTAFEEDSDVTSTFVPGFSNAGNDEFDTTNDAVWAEHAVVQDFTAEEIDGVVITFNFPSGWYRTDQTTGSALAAFLRYQVRYIELDGAGSPIASGGFPAANDGYVRLPLVGPLALRQESPFQAQFRTQFVDPQSYLPSTPGKALLTTSTSNSNASYALAASQGYSTGTEIPFLGGFAWINVSTLADQVIIDSLNTGTNRGFRLELATRTFTTFSGVVTTVRVLQLRLGRGSRILDFYASVNLGGLGGTGAPTTVQDGLFEAASLGQWVHVGFRYIRNDRVELCVNGRVIGTANVEVLHNNDLEWDRRALVIGSGATMLVDEVKLYNAAIGAPQFAADYSGGEGSVGAALGLEDRMIFRASFEGAAGTNSSTSASAYWAATPTLNNGATSGSATGFVRSGADQKLKRSKYRVEVLRCSRGSTKSSIANTVEVDAMSSVISESLTYPNSPLLGIEIDATEQLNDGIPTTTAVVEGIICPVWDGQSLLVPAIRQQFSKNPAWVSLKFITDRRFGIGRFYDTADVDLTKWFEWAAYCDELTYDGQRRITVTNPGTDKNADVYFSNAWPDPNTGELRGEIWFEIGIVEQPTLPSNWEAGYHLLFASFPTDAETGVNNDIDSPAETAYEIFSVELIDGVWTVKCYWDRLAETDPWTSGSRLGADILTVADLNDSVVSGAGRRFEFNGTYDSIGTAWDSLLDLMAVGRATPVPLGSKLSLRYAHPRSAVGVVTPSNIIEGTFVCDYSSPRTRANSMTLNILDAEQNYEPVPVAVQSAELDAITDQSFIRQQNNQLFGVTDVGQAERHGNYVLNVNRLQRRSGSFSAALDTLPYQVGDVLRVSSEVLPRGSGGRFAASSFSTKLASLSDREDFSSGNWAATSCTVTANTATDPYGDATADTLDGVGYVQQALGFPDLRDGWVSVGVFIKAGTSAASNIELVNDRGSQRITYTFGTGIVSLTDSFEIPARGTMRDVGSSWFYCTASFFVKAGAGKELSTTMNLRLYPGSPSATGTAFFSKVVATQAEHAAPAQDFRGFVIDGDVTVAAGVTNTVTIQDFRGSIYSGTIDLTMTPAGTYSAGDTLFMSAGLDTIATRGASYIVSTAANELLIELSGMSRQADLSAEFQWIEYDADVFLDTATEDSDGGGTVIPPGGGGGTIPDIRPKEPVISMGFSSLTEPDPGSFVSSLTVAWEHEHETRKQLLSTGIYWRESPSTFEVGGAWEFAIEVHGLGGTASFPLAGMSVGSLIEVSIVPRTRGFSSMNPDEGARFTVKLRGLAWRPEAPTALTADIRDTGAEYDVDFATARDGTDRTKALKAEYRRGGWILGQKVAVATEGDPAFGPTHDLYQALSSTAADLAVGRLHARMLARSGMHSAEATLDVSLAPPAATDTPDVGMGSTERWETSSSGSSWVEGVPGIGDAVISGDLVVNAAGELEFDTTGLVGTYKVKSDAAAAAQLGQSRQPRELFVMAAVEAEQVHPITFANMTTPFGSLELQRWSFEGPTSPRDEDLANCQVRIQIRVNVTGGSSSSDWSSWLPFKCGLYTATDVQLRLLVNRPDENYNLRIKSFHSNIILPRRALSEQTSRDLHSRSEII